MQETAASAPQLWPSETDGVKSPWVFSPFSLSLGVISLYIGQRRVNREPTAGCVLLGSFVVDWTAFFTRRDETLRVP